MNYRTNEDKRSVNEGMNYNLIHSVEDISDESGEPTEPVTLAEMKKYLRIEGYGSTAGILNQEPLSLSLGGGNFVQDSLLQQASAKIISVSREGLGYSPTTGTPGDRQYVHDNDAGTITFRDDGTGTVDITWGLLSENADDWDSGFDDDLIESMITGARERIEIYTNCSLIPKTISAVVTNLCGNISLPAGPVTGDVTAVDSEGEEIVADDIKLIGTKFPELKQPLQAEIKLTYNAGYSTLPKGLKLAIMAEVAYRYENRGEESIDNGICKAAIVLANPYKRGSAFG